MEIRKFGRTHYVWIIGLLTVALWLAACGEATPTPFPTGSAQTPATESTTGPEADEATDVPKQTFHSPEGQFRIDLPGNWEVEEQGRTPLGLQYVMGPPPLGPGPASSTLFVASADELTAEEAAEQLSCAEECAEEIELEETVVGDMPAQRVTLGEAPALEWYFVAEGKRLIFFTIHDPETFATLDDVVATFRLEAPAAQDGDDVTPTLAPTEVSVEATRATATPAPRVTIEAVRQWREVVVEEAGITFEAPSEWESMDEEVWTPVGEPSLSLHFAWQQTGPDATAADVLAAEAEIMATSPLTLSWGSGISATVSAGETIQRHMVVQVGLRTYDFYTSGSSRQSVDAAQPVLDHVTGSVSVQERLLYFEDPVDTAVAFFRVLLRDPSGEAALPYLSADLRSQIAEGDDPMSLLSLPQRYHTFNLEWQSGSESEAILSGTLTLQDDSTVRRDVQLVFDEAIGWRVDAIEEASDTPAEG